jgi:hypothetical protein
MARISRSSQIADPVPFDTNVFFDVSNIIPSALCGCSPLRVIATSVVNPTT